MNEGLAASTLFAYVQMLDSAFPIGGFSHSFGLETFVQKGKIADLHQLEQYIAGQLQATVLPLDVLCVQAIYRALDATHAPEEMGSPLTWEQAEQEIRRIDGICHTQRAARESREGMRKMGRRLIKLGHSLYPEAELGLLERLLAVGRGHGTFPVVFAWIGWHLRLDFELAVSGYLYTNVQLTVNSALRLMSLGQTDGQLLIRRLVPQALGWWTAFKEEGHEEPFSYALVQEIYAMQHEGLYSRLFMS